MLATTATLAGLALLLIWPAPALLERAAWPGREPRAALVLWQALGLAAGLALVGTFVTMALAPLGDTLPAALRTGAGRFADGQPTAGLGAGHVVLLTLAIALLGRLLGVTALSVSRTWRARTRHRELVDLVGSPGPVRFIDHPAVAAYCLPGQRSRVVVTSGAVALLDPDELEAVIAHEHAHLSERHDLVVLPFVAWASAIPWLSGPRRARTAVATLVEMVADDRACAGCDRTVLAAALARVGSAAVPAGALGVAEATVLPRVRRLLDAPRPSRLIRAGALSLAAGVITAPTLVLFLSTPWT